MKYICEICGGIFEDAVKCTEHETVHTFEDRYGRIYKITNSEYRSVYFIPGGRIIMPDGHDLISGKEMEISPSIGVRVSDAHYPIEVVEKSSYADPTIEFAWMVGVVRDTVIKEGRVEHYIEWKKRKGVYD